MPTDQYIHCPWRSDISDIVNSVYMYVKQDVEEPVLSRVFLRNYAERRIGTAILQVYLSICLTPYDIVC